MGICDAAVVPSARTLPLELSSRTVRGLLPLIRLTRTVAD